MAKSRNAIYRKDKNSYIKRNTTFGTMYFGRELPFNSVFGKWNGYPFYCTFCEDNESIDGDGTMVLYRIDKQGKWHKHWSCDTDGLLSAIRKHCYNNGVKPAKTTRKSAGYKKCSQSTVRERKVGAYLPMSCNYNQRQVDGGTLGGSYVREETNELVEMDSYIKGDKSARSTNSLEYWALQGIYMNKSVEQKNLNRRDSLKVTHKDYHHDSVSRKAQNMRDIAKH